MSAEKFLLIAIFLGVQIVTKDVTINVGSDIPGLMIVGYHSNLDLKGVLFETPML